MNKLIFYLDRLLFRQYREVVAPISQEGIAVHDIHCNTPDGKFSARQFEGTVRPESFGPSTVILSAGHGVWKFDIPKYIRDALADISLRVETVRTHGMLHSPKQGKSASIYNNDQLVDKIYLVRPHPHGEDFGVDSRRPLPVLGYIETGKDTQTVRIEVDQDVYWDIDRVSLRTP